MSFKPIDAKRDEFRKYLEKTGVLDAISKVFIKLIETQDRPENAIEYVRQNLGASVERNDNNQRLKLELEDAYNEIARLKRMVQDLESETGKNSSTITSTITSSTCNATDSSDVSNKENEIVSESNKSTDYCNEQNSPDTIIHEKNNVNDNDSLTPSSDKDETLKTEAEDDKNSKETDTAVVSEKSDTTENNN